MAVPKRKQSKQRQAKRRTHWKMEKPTLVKCSHCGAVKLPHRVCPQCGYYRNRQILEVG
jgi:large subunit ribosomal protein L32